MERQHRACKKTQRQTLSPAGPKIEILADGDQFLPFASRDRLLFAEVCKALAEPSVNA
jgi:hypothetical protein